MTCSLSSNKLHELKIAQNGYTKATKSNTPEDKPDLRAHSKRVRGMCGLHRQCTISKQTLADKHFIYSCSQFFLDNYDKYHSYSIVYNNLTLQ